MSVRPPQAPDRLSSLSSALGDSPSERRSPGHHRQPSDASESTELVQRCVVIQRDQHGFGFTVSGDRAVLVQSVRPGGAAMRAGVQEGDRILKVNGTMVANNSHLEVVKLIKSGAYVALTLLGSPAGPAGIPGSQQEPEPSGCPQGPPQLITEPRPLQDPEVRKHAAEILQNMLRQAEAELQRCQAGAAGQEQLEAARRRLEQLKLKVLQESRCSQSQDSGSRPLEGEFRRSLAGSPQLPGRFPRDPRDGDPGLESGPERLPALAEVSRNSGFSQPGSPRSSPVLGSRLATDPGSGRPQIIGPEEDCEPGSGSSERDSVFQDLGILKSRPAHLGVFLRFLFSQADPTPLLFHLCSEVCCQQSNPRDSRALGRHIWNIFLDRSAPLRVKVPEQLLAEIELHLRNGEELRPALLEAQEFVIPEIQEQLQDYRAKRTLGLGGLYGENELQQLEQLEQLEKHLEKAPEQPEEPRERRECRERRERAAAERQLGHLGDILSKYEEERSAPMAFALSTFMAHAGIRPREFREFQESQNPGASEKIPDKDKWLPFFPKAKKSSSSRKEKEQRQNPILKYIGKPRSSSQSTFHVPLSPTEGGKPGSVRTMIQHFENGHGEPPEPEPGPQRRSTGSVPEGLLEPASCRAEVRLGRSESLKGREELRRSRRAEPVPRSRSDVDMDTGNSGNAGSAGSTGSDTPRLHSASSSASSLSNRSLENPTPPYTPKMGRRSMDSPFGADPFLPHLLEDEQGPVPDLEADPESQNPPNSQSWQQNSPNSQSWQHSVSRELLASLSQREVDRQEVINELFVTELSHLRILRVLDSLFLQRLRREQLLSREELGLLFPNLPELIGVHNSLWESMRRLREEQGPVIGGIGDLMLARFEGAAQEEFQRAAAAFCSSQSIALELIRSKQRKEARFQSFIQEAESQPQCRRLQLKDLLIAEMQRLTKYPLLLENVLKCTPAGSAEQEKLRRARERSRAVLRAVNEAVRRAENRQRLREHQRRLDTSALERSSNPLAAEFRNLDLTSHRMIHEGPLSWRVGKDKSVELHVLLLEELLVLLQRQDERWLLKCHSRGLAADTKQSFSPVLKLSSLLVRSVATDKRALFIICTSELGPQIYELVALTSSEKNTWMQLLEQAVQGATRSLPGPPKQEQSEASGNGAAGLLLPDPAVSPELARDTEPEDCSSAGSDPEPSGRARALQELLEEPRGAGPGDPDPDLGHPDPIPGTPKSPGSAGVAEAALQDVETLRLLIVRRLRPGRDPDVSSWEFPTASQDSRMSSREFPMSGREFPTASQDLAMSVQDSRMSSREFPMSGREFPTASQDLATSGQEFPASGRDSSMSSWEFPVSGQEFPMSSREFPKSSQEFPMSSQEGPEGPEPNGIRINRKAQEEGPEEATPPRGCSQSEPELREGGGASAEGNFFYLSLPRGRPRPGGDVGDIPGDTPGDTELILGTLEELRGKLLSLRALEAAHRHLLRSLRGDKATVPSVPAVPGVPSPVPRWAPPPPSTAQAPRGHGATRAGAATKGTGSDAPAHL